MATKANKCTTDRYSELCEVLHEAIFGDKCVLCSAPRHGRNKFCKQCYGLCPKTKPVYDEITIRIKIRKDPV